jgi:hypothetical protein
MDDTRMPTKVLKGKFHGRPQLTAGHQEQLLFAAEYERMEETNRGQGYLVGTTEEARLLCY